MSGNEPIPQPLFGEGHSAKLVALSEPHSGRLPSWKQKDITKWKKSSTFQRCPRPVTRKSP